MQSVRGEDIVSQPRDEPVVQGSNAPFVSDHQGLQVAGNEVDKLYGGMPTIGSLRRDKTIFSWAPNEAGRAEPRKAAFPTSLILGLFTASAIY